jgi:hypothetical protein
MPFLEFLGLSHDMVEPLTGSRLVACARPQLNPQKQTIHPQSRWIIYRALMLVHHQDSLHSIECQEPSAGILPGQEICHMLGFGPAPLVAGPDPDLPRLFKDVGLEQMGCESITKRLTRVQYVSRMLIDADPFCNRLP